VPARNIYSGEGGAGTGKNTLAAQLVLEGNQQNEGCLYAICPNRKAELDFALVPL
jgi:hypothetical protein